MEQWQDLAGGLTVGWNTYFLNPENPELESPQLFVGSQVREGR